MVPQMAEKSTEKPEKQFSEKQQNYFKATRKEMKIRFDDAFKKYCSGWTRRNIVEYLVTAYSISENTARRDVLKVVDACADEISSYDRKRYAAKLIANAESGLQDALEKGQLSNSVAFLNFLARIGRVDPASTKGL